MPRSHTFFLYSRVVSLISFHVSFIYNRHKDEQITQTHKANNSAMIIAITFWSMWSLTWIVNRHGWISLLFSYRWRTVGTNVPIHIWFFSSLFWSGRLWIDSRECVSLVMQFLNWLFLSFWIIMMNNNNNNKTSSRYDKK